MKYGSLCVAALAFASWSASAGNIFVQAPAYMAPFVRCELSFNGTCTTIFSDLHHLTFVATERSHPLDLAAGTIRYVTWRDPDASDPVAGIRAIFRLVAGDPVPNGDQILTMDLFTQGAPEFESLRGLAALAPSFLLGQFTDFVGSVWTHELETAYDLQAGLLITLPEPSSFALLLIGLIGLWRLPQAVHLTS